METRNFPSLRVPPTHLRLMRNPRTCAPTNGVQQYILPPQSFPRESAGGKSLKAKLEMTITREFPGYWRLFRTLHVSRYDARLAEERIWHARLTFTFDRFWFATLK